MLPRIVVYTFVELKATGIQDINKIPGLMETEITVLPRNRSLVLQFFNFDIFYMIQIYIT